MPDKPHVSKTPHKTTTCGVRVNTWGSDTKGGNGALQFMDAKFFGGNLGHASITLTIPVDKEGRADDLIAKYCNNEDKPKIPFVKKVVNVVKAKIDPKTGRAVKGEETVHQEEVYEIYFSWWPGRPPGNIAPGTEAAQQPPYALKQNVAKDRASERDAVPFEWAEEWQQYINPEMRRYRAKFGDRRMVLGPANVFHARGLSEAETEEMAYSAVVVDLLRERRSLELLLTKLKADPNKEFTIGATEKILLNRFIPEWEEKVKNIASQEEKREFLYKIAQDTDAQYQQVGGSLDRYPCLPTFKNVLALMARTPVDQDFVKNAVAYLEKQKIGIDGQDKSLNDIVQELVPHYKTFLYKLNHSQQPVTEEDIKELSDSFALKLEELKEKVHAVAPQLIFPEHAFELGLQYVVEEYRTEGKPPDNVVKLPLSSDSFPGSGVGHEDGLDAEAMLQQMQSLMQDDQTGFHLMTKNCSLTVGSVLEAGAKKPYIKDTFRNKAFGFFGTPQEIFNNVSKAHDEIYSGEAANPSLLNKILFDPIKKAGGFCIGIIMKPEAGFKGTLKTGAAYAGGIIVGAVAMVLLPIKAMANPLKAFKNSKDFIEFVLNRPFKGGAKILQVLFVAAGGLGVLVFAIPAGIQKGFRALREWATHNPERLRKSELLISAAREEALPDHEREKAAKERIKQARIQSVLAKGLKAKTKTIEMDDPIRALRQFKVELDTKTSIPVFAPKTQTRIHDAIFNDSPVPEDLAEFGTSLKEVYRNLYDRSHQLMKEFEKDILKSLHDHQNVSELITPKKMVVTETVTETAKPAHATIKTPVPKSVDKASRKIDETKPEKRKVKEKAELRTEPGLDSFKTHQERHKERHREATNEIGLPTKPKNKKLKPSQDK